MAGSEIAIQITVDIRMWSLGVVGGLDAWPGGEWCALRSVFAGELAERVAVEP